MRGHSLELHLSYLHGNQMMITLVYPERKPGRWITQVESCLLQQFYGINWWDGHGRDRGVGGVVEVRGRKERLPRMIGTSQRHPGWVRSRGGQEYPGMQGGLLRHWSTNEVLYGSTSSSTVVLQ